MSGQLKEVRDRIKSVKSTQQITKAMKMVSAAKLKRATDAIVQMRPYANRLNKMLKNILSNLEGDVNSSFGTEREINRAAIIVVTSNRGLCGAFNTNVIKGAVAKIEEKYAHLNNSENLSIICVGKKGFDFFRKRYAKCNIINEFGDIYADLSFDNIARVSQFVMDKFEDGSYDAVEVAYGRFRNAGMQFPEVAQFLPVEKIAAEGKDENKLKADYIFEPSKEELLEYLIPSILQTTFQKFVLDTHASEHGARMTAMDKATENAEDLVKELKISYNKARQEAITKELSEIVGGAAALGG